MLTLYTSSGNTSSTRAKQWLEHYKINFKEVKIDREGITRAELIKIFSLIEEGVDSVLVRKGRLANNILTNLDTLTMNQLLLFIENNPRLLRLPIILTDRYILSGFNAEDIRTCLSREFRNERINRYINPYLTIS